jgi:hypothetical protein
LDPVAQAAEATSHAGGAHLALSIQASSAALSVPFTISGHGFFNYKTQEGALELDMSGLPGAPGASLRGPVRTKEVYKSSTIYVGSPLLAARLPGGASWIKLDLSSVGQAFGLNIGQLTGGQSNPAQFLEYLRASGDVTVAGHELVRGVSSTHYRATLDLAKVADALPAAIRAQLRQALAKLVAASGLRRIPVDVWVDGQGLVRRMTLALTALMGGQQLHIRLNLELFGFGAAPPVVLPSDREVFVATKTALTGFAAG